MLGAAAGRPGGGRRRGRGGAGGARPSIAVATCAALPGLLAEGRLLCEALEGLGARAVPVVWDSGADWDAFDAVIVRTAEDWFRDPGRFLAWARSLGAVFNEPEVMAWNHDKRYLAELGLAGVPVIDTQYIEPGGAWRQPAGACVVKPAIGAGSNAAAAYAPGEGAAVAAHIAGLHAAGRTAMLQPYCDAVDDDGETAVVYIGGAFSHGMGKEPILRPGQPPADSRPERMSARDPDPDVLDVAEMAHAWVSARFGPPLFARIDVIRDPGGAPAVLEAELIEPLLFLDHRPGSAGRLASALLERAGLPALAPSGAVA